MANKDHVDYYYVRWFAMAEINDTRIQIAGVDIGYALDTLPSATITVVVGRDPTNNEEAKAVDAFLSAKPYTNIKIFVRGETELDSPIGKDDPGFPFNEDVLVFDGLLVGVSYGTFRSPAGGSVSLQASCVGWLAALGGSVSTTIESTVKGPGGFDELANLGSSSALRLFDISNTYGTKSSGVVTDLWKEFIKPLMKAITQSKNVWGESDNKSAQEALDRMDQHRSETDLDANLKLAFPVARSGVSSEYVEKFLVEQVAQVVYGLWRDNDLWSTLVKLADMFKFAIVPVIDTAFCAPVFPTLGGEPYIQIGTDEYFALTYRATSEANVTRIVVTGEIGTDSVPFDAGPRKAGILGMYTVKDALDLSKNVIGVTRSLMAPTWLSAEIPLGKLTRDSLGKDKLAIPDAVNPDANVEEPDETYYNLYNEYTTSEVGDDYAKLLGQALFLNGRYGDLTGRFRLDISPGSTVAIDVIDDKFSSGSEPKQIVGTIVAVALKLRAGGAGDMGEAGTRFSMSHLRSPTEHQSEQLTTEKHPIYGVRFAGTKLWFS